MYLQTVQGKRRTLDLKCAAILDTVSILAAIYVAQEKLAEAKEMDLYSLRGYEEIESSPITVS